MKTNVSAEKFWKHCGFEEVGIEKENEHGRVVLLEKRL